MKTSFSYSYVLEYIPTRFSATFDQCNDRRSVYNFKDRGDCSEKIFQGFVAGIKNFVGCNKNDYVICFIPASSSAKTSIRYYNLAQRLQNATGVKACFSAISRSYDKASGYLNGKSGNPIEGMAFDNSCFRGKKVILIDDVITRGTTFRMTANRLMELGAEDVMGLFVAKTVHPQYNRVCA